MPLMRRDFTPALAAGAGGPPLGGCIVGAQKAGRA